MAQKPFFSIIIPCLNEEKYLPLLLKDLSNQSIDDFEVVVVDGGSTDQTVKKASLMQDDLPSLTILHSKIKNVSIQRNLGASKASGEYIVFNDADNRLSKFFLEGLRYKLRTKQADVFTCWTTPATSKQADKTIATACNLIVEANFLAGSPVSFGAMIGCKSKVFSQTPGFNPEIGFAEDTDFVRNAFHQGFSFHVFHDPKYTYSLRRFKSQGALKVIQKSATLLLKYYTGQKVDQKKEYPMGGENIDSLNKNNQDLLEKINNFLNQPIKKPKIIEKIQTLLLNLDEES
jgi:glycosyltransferase involved in cell wall biosynthesis